MVLLMSYHGMARKQMSFLDGEKWPNTWMLWPTDFIRSPIGSARIHDRWGALDPRYHGTLKNNGCTSSTTVWIKCP